MDLERIWRPALAEFLGTFALVFIGAGAVVAGGGTLEIALAFGLTLMAMSYALGHISGTHINPAVTLAMLLADKIEAAVAGTYILAQLFGAVVAGVVLKLVSPDQIAAATHLGTTRLADHLSAPQGVLIEAVLTFLLVLTIFGVAVDERGSTPLAGLAIGLVLTLDILMGGPLTGASMNPARSLGPALASGFWDDHLVYWIGPLLGAAAASLLYQAAFLGGVRWAIPGLSAPRRRAGPAKPARRRGR
ncbi:MAG: MIP family channel protein [Chloroflexi bacterium]|nr:MIP family channel protein [Chloroflexota bacterium]